MLCISNRPLSAQEHRTYRWARFRPSVVGGLGLGIVYPALLGVILVPIAAMITLLELLLDGSWWAFWIVPTCLAALLALAGLIALPTISISCLREQRQRLQELRNGVAEVLEGTGQWAWVTYGPKDEEHRHPRLVYLVEPDTLVVVPGDSITTGHDLLRLEEVPAEFRVEILPMSRHVLAASTSGTHIPVFTLSSSKAPAHAWWPCATTPGDVIRRAALEPDFHIAFVRPA